MSAQSVATGVDLRQLFASLARNWPRILLVTLIVTGLAFAFAWLVTPRYKATTMLKTQQSEAAGTNEDAKPGLDAEGVAREVQVISSSDILKQVADKLNLAKLPEFDDTLGMSPVNWLLVTAGLKSDPQEIPLDERVLQKMRDKLNVYGAEKTGAVAVEFSSQDPRLAADIPNAIAAAYIAYQTQAKIKANSAASTLVGPETNALQEQVRAAEAKVAAYRAQSDLLMDGNNSVPATQQLSDLSAELSRVRASRTSDEATADKLRQALQNGSSLDAVPEVLSSELIQPLRERQIQLRTSITDLSTTLLDNHPRMRALRSQLADLNGQIHNEAQKVMRGLLTQVQMAEAREDQLVSDMKAASLRAGEEQAELETLQRDATAKRQQLESYLTSFRGASSRKNYMPVDASVSSEARAPSEPYFPKLVPIVGAAFVGSLLLMSIFTLLRELFSGRAKRPAPGARFERIEQVAMPAMPAPAVEPEPAAAEAVEDRPADTEAEPQPEPASAALEEAAATDAEPQAEPQVEFEPAPSVLGEIDVEKAAEKLIASGAARAIFVSPEGDEAAASAVLVAREISDTGLRVLLLDLTASGAASRPMLDSGLFPGITNLLASEAQFSDVIHADLYSDCHVVPVGTADPVRAMRAADRLPIIMQSLTTAYDLVVVECGPADAQGISRLVGDGTEVFLSMLEPDDEVTQAAVKLIESGYPDLILVTPVGHQTPGNPVPGRRSAA